MSLQNNDTTSSFPITAIMRYQLKNNTLLSLGINDYNHFDIPFPQTLSASIMRGKEMQNGVKIHGGIYSSYSFIQKVLSSIKFAFSIKNAKFNTLLNFIILNKKTLNEEDSEKKILECKKYNRGKDKSLLLTINHYFRDIIRMSKSEKLIPVKNVSSHSIIPSYKTKLGISFDVTETII